MTTRVRRRVRVLGRLAVSPAHRLTAASRRSIAYLAVKGPVAQRALMSVELWPGALESRARANLRRAIWQTPDGWVQAGTWEVQLAAEIDLAEARTAADRAMQLLPLDAHEIDLLSQDLLPGWYDEWLLGEQDSYHLMRLQALEQSCRVATGLRQFGLATRAGLAAVCAEPLRESAVSALVDAHLREGNTYEAVRRFRTYRELLRQELGASPSKELSALVADVSPASATRHPGPGRPGRPPGTGSVEPDHRRGLRGDGGALR